MDNVKIVDYFATTASNKEWEMVSKVYTKETLDLLNSMGLGGQEDFTITDLITIMTRALLERDLEEQQHYLREVSSGDNKETIESFIENIEWRLEDWKND